MHTRRLRFIFVAGFFFSAHLGLLAYLNSTMLSQLVSERMVSTLFALGSALSVVLLYSAPLLVRRLGNTRLSIIVALTSMVLLATVSLAPHTLTRALAFVGYFALNAVLLYSLDIFIEHYSKRRMIGNIRGTYLTINNLGWVLMPFAAGSIAALYGVSVVYLAAGATFALCALSIALSQRNFEDAPYHPYNIGELFHALKQNNTVRRIITSNFFLQAFFAWMVIYLPLYLHEQLSFSIAETGVIFTIMLLPFVLCEYPAGKIADSMKNGERYFIIWGFIAMGLATLILVSVEAPSLWLVAAILFATRVGASVVEVMNDSYFFKHVDDRDVSLIGLYRMTLPLAYLIGPLVGAVVLSFTSKQGLFMILGLGMLLSAWYARRIPKAR